MSDLQSNIQRILDQMDSPVVKMAREFQQKMDAYQPPNLKAFLELNRKMRDLVSPAIKSILSNHEQLRLSINPQFYEFLAQHDQISSKVQPHHTMFNTLSYDTAKMSKWLPNLDTPASVYNQIATFRKAVYSSALMLKQVRSYNGYFDRLGHFGSLTDAVPVASFDLTMFRNIDYTLVDDENCEPESQIILLDEGARIKLIIKDIYQNNHSLYTMPPNEFENVIAELLRSQHFDVEMTKRTRDGGYDLIAVQNIGGFGVRFLVECKRYAMSRKIGVGIVRSFRDVINTEGANKGIIVTSSYFSLDAEKDRQRNKPYMLDFKDHNDVIKWVNKYVTD